MALNVKKTTGKQYHPVFLDILEVETGGVTLATERIPSTTKFLKAGTLMSTSGTTGVWQFVKRAKSARTQAVGGTVFPVTTMQEFNVGDFIAIASKSTGSTITVIDTTTSPNTIIITTSADLGSMNTNSRIVEVKAAGAVATKYVPTAMLRDTYRVHSDDLATLKNVMASVVVRGSVDQSLMPYPPIASDKTAMTARIRFA